MRENLHAMLRSNKAASQALNAADAAARAKFGPRVVGARQRAGLTREALAPRLGVTPHTLLLWEKGKRSPHLSQLVRLAEVLHVSTDYLLGVTTPAATTE